MNQKHTSNRTINFDEIENFDRLSSEWWDENGPFKPLHQLNPTRIHFIRDVILAHFARSMAHDTPFEGLSVLDIGCGGGLVCEPLSRLGATVLGIDMGEKTIDVARHHAEQMGLSIQYRVASTSDLVLEKRKFDVVTALEVVEHVGDVPLFIQECAQLVRPGGSLIMSTLNRTYKSYLMAILGAEYILRWVPPGTHQWEKFLTPAELANYLRHEGIIIKELRGLEFNPITWSWSLGSDLAVNYLVYGAKA
jgi:2-polyprenyl-6-hydroxyphenyl methylase/3-demethylubiquinone-9 3-methyltransferase